MRIALVAPFGLRTKGTARARALPLGKALVRRGHRVALFVPPYDGAEDAGLSWTDDGVDIVNVVLPGAPPLGPAGHIRLGWRLLLAARAWQPDLVHVFKPKGPSGLAAAGEWMASRRDRRPLIVDSDDWEGPGGWNDDPRASYTAAQRRFFAWQERYGLSHAGAWTVASACLRDRAIAFGAAPDRVFVLPNGIDRPTWSGSLEGEAPGAREEEPNGIADREPREGTRPVILYSRFAGVRVADVEAIWRRVAAALPDARLIVIGRGLAGEEGELAGLAPGVEVRGWIEPGAMLPLFHEAALAMIPWADTPANRARNSAKVLELMNAGLPLVAYAVGELPATVDNAGVLVQPGDQAAFANAVIDLLRDTERARHLGRAAQKRIARCYTWDRLAEIALAAYAAAGDPRPR